MLTSDEPESSDQQQGFPRGHQRVPSHMPPISRHARTDSLAAAASQGHAHTEAAGDLEFLQSPNLSASDPISNACPNSKPLRKPRAIQFPNLGSHSNSASDSDPEFEFSRSSSKRAITRSSVTRTARSGVARPSSRASARTSLSWKSKVLGSLATHLGSEGVFTSQAKSKQRTKIKHSRMEDNEIDSFIQQSNTLDLNNSPQHVGLGIGISPDPQNIAKATDTNEIADGELYAPPGLPQAINNFAPGNGLLASNGRSTSQNGASQFDESRAVVDPYRFDPSSLNNPRVQRTTEPLESNQDIPDANRNFLRFSISPDTQGNTGQLHQRFEFPPAQQKLWQTSMVHNQYLLQLDSQQVRNSQPSLSFPAQSKPVQQKPMQPTQAQFKDSCVSNTGPQAQFEQDQLQDPQRAQQNLQQQFHQQQFHRQQFQQQFQHQQQQFQQHQTQLQQLQHQQIQHQQFQQQQIQHQQIRQVQHQQQQFQQQHLQQQQQQQQKLQQLQLPQQLQSGIPQSPSHHSRSSSQSSTRKSPDLNSSQHLLSDNRMDDDDDDEDYLPPNSPERGGVSRPGQSRSAKVGHSSRAHRHNNSPSGQVTTGIYSSSVLHDTRARGAGGVQKPDARDFRQPRPIGTERGRRLVQDLAEDLATGGGGLVKHEQDSQVPAEKNFVPSRRIKISTSGVALRSAQANTRKGETPNSTKVEEGAAAPAVELSKSFMEPSTPSNTKKQASAVGEQTLSLAGLPSGPPASHSLAYKSKYMYEEPDRRNLVLPHEAPLSLRELSAKLQANNGLPDDDAMDVPGPDYPEEAVTAEWSEQDDEELLELLEAAERHKWRYVSELMTEKQQKRVPVRPCKMKFDSMFGETEASSLLRTSLFYVAYRSGWATIKAARTAEEREQEASKRAKEAAESDNNPGKDKEGSTGSKPDTDKDLQPSHKEADMNNFADPDASYKQKRPSEGDVGESVTRVSSSNSLIASSANFLQQAVSPLTSKPPLPSQVSSILRPDLDGSSANGTDYLQEIFQPLGSDASLPDQPSISKESTLTPDPEEKQIQSSAYASNIEFI